MKLTRSQLRRIISEEAVTVKSGDTLSKIAKEKGVGVDAILAANPQFDASQLGNWKRGDTPGEGDVVGGTNRNPNWIYPGDKINIPGEAAGGSASGQSTAAGGTASSTGKTGASSAPKGGPVAGVQLDTSASGDRGEVVVQALGKDLIDNCMQEKIQLLQKVEDYVKKLKEEMQGSK